MAGTRYERMVKEAAIDVDEAKNYAAVLYYYCTAIGYNSYPSTNYFLKNQNAGVDIAIFPAVFVGREVCKLWAEQNNERLEPVVGEGAECWQKSAVCFVSTLCACIPLCCYFYLSHRDKMAKPTSSECKLIADLVDHSLKNCCVQERIVPFEVMIQTKLNSKGKSESKEESHEQAMARWKLAQTEVIQAAIQDEAKRTLIALENALRVTTRQAIRERLSILRATVASAHGIPLAQIENLSSSVHSFIPAPASTSELVPLVTRTTYGSTAR